MVNKSMQLAAKRSLNLEKTHMYGHELKCKNGNTESRWLGEDSVQEENVLLFWLGLVPFRENQVLFFFQSGRNVRKRRMS